MFFFQLKTTLQHERVPFRPLFYNTTVQKIFTFFHSKDDIMFFSQSLFYNVLHLIIFSL
jgi:hypothetical protein